MVTQLSPSIQGLVEPGAPLWAQRMVLKLASYFLPVEQRAPLTVWATTKAKLPPAADWPNSIVVVTDQNAIALSLGGVWLKIATSGPI